jgi:uncharacterized protein (TIGR02594 family)
VPDLKLNDRGIEVRKLQILLNTLVIPSPALKVDGHFGLKTELAVNAFQKCKNLVVDGKVGPKTREALGLKSIVAPTPVIIAPISPWTDIAIAELGVHEDSRPGKHTARIVEYHKTTTLKATDDETPWCSSFVNWVMIQSGRRGTNNALARSWLDWGQAVTTPSTGVVVVIKKKTPGSTNATGSSSGFHVGFYLSSSATSIEILGGNQNDRVKKSSFSLNTYEIKGYRKP